MKIAIAQINPTVGDFDQNSSKILEIIKLSKSQKADLIITPELSISGYTPEDLLLRDDFNQKSKACLQALARKVTDIKLIVGHHHKVGKEIYNSASLLGSGKILGTYNKIKLPNYSVFDEKRYFSPGLETFSFFIEENKIGVSICEDIWENSSELNSTLLCPIKDLKRKEVNLLLVLNASPYHQKKHLMRLNVATNCAKKNNFPIVFCNQVGGQDELIFDGRSFVLDRKGNVAYQMKAFEEDLGFIEFIGKEPITKKSLTKSPSDINLTYSALRLGVKDYVRKNSFKGVIIGLSGGVDSALTTCIAVDALGNKNVKVVMMPSKFTSEASLEDSREIAKNLNLEFSVISIEKIYEVFMQNLDTHFQNLPKDTTEENLQSRIRGNLLMSLSNKFGYLVLTTGNKSEMSTGYATLYGDMAGGFSVLKDVTKGQVYDLIKYRNQFDKIIPERVITRPPSAELSFNQLDSDTLPDYDILDQIIELYVESNLSAKQIIDKGFAKNDVIKIINLIHINEYKRRQSAVGVKLTKKSYGKDWRFPIVNKFRSL